jgi:serine/threonine protein kinase
MLHACGVVHSDLKHENILIFENRLDMPGLPYTAKLADFGGSFMDIAEGEARPLRMGTWPFTAPEFGAPLSIDQLKQSDVYSFGLLVWRTIVDCENIIAAAGLNSLSSQSGRNEFENLKSSNELVVRAKISIENYALRHNLPPESAALILYILDCTIQAAPSSRGLPKAQAALRGLE